MTRTGLIWQIGHPPRYAQRWIIFLPQIFLPARPTSIIESGTKEWGQRNSILLPPFFCRSFTSQYRYFTRQPPHIDLDDDPCRHFQSAGECAGGVAGGPTAKFPRELSRAGDFGGFGKERGREGQRKRKVRDSFPPPSPGGILGWDERDERGRRQAERRTTSRFQDGTPFLKEPSPLAMAGAEPARAGKRRREAASERIWRQSRMDSARTEHSEVNFAATPFPRRGWLRGSQ